MSAPIVRTNDAVIEATLVAACVRASGSVHSFTQVTPAEVADFARALYVEVKRAPFVAEPATTGDGA